MLIELNTFENHSAGSKLSTNTYLMSVDFKCNSIVYTSTIFQY